MKANPGKVDGLGRWPRWLCVLLRAGWALQVFTGPPCYTLHAPALLWDFHSDNNHPSLDAFLVDQMLFCVSYQLITCNVWQGMKSIDGDIWQWWGLFSSFFILVAFKWHRHIVKKYCQGCDFSKLADEKTATSCEGERAHGGRCLHPGGEGLLQLCPSTGGFQPISLPGGICKTWWWDYSQQYQAQEVPSTLSPITGSTVLPWKAELLCSSVRAAAEF